MRLLFIRHGDPDYANDTLTEKGWREVELLAERAESLDMGACYVSPLGRAQDTAAPSLKRTGKTAQTVGWLEEFPAKIDLNKVPELVKAYPDTKKEEGKYRSRIIWDIVPSYWTERREYFDSEKWRISEISRNSDVVETYDRVTGSFDALLAKGHSIVVVEHNPDVIRAADWVIDLGPDAGDKGGEVVFEGTPEDLVKKGGTFTAEYLK